MVKACSAWNCKARDTPENKSKGITFHVFPKDTVRRNAWALATRREGFKKGTLWKPSKHSYLCSKHFLDKDFEVNPNCSRLRENVIPSVFQFPDYITNGVLPVIQHTLKKEAEPIPSPSSIDHSYEKKQSYSIKDHVSDHITNAELPVIQHTPEKETASIPTLSSTDHSYGTKKYYSIEHHVANSLKRKLEALEEKHKRAYNELRKARKVISLQEKKIQILSNDLEEQKKLNETEKNTMLEDMDGPTGLLKELVSVKRMGVPYSDDMKMFAKTLRQFSPNAYEFLRKTLNLPSSRTLRQKKEAAVVSPDEVCTQTAQVLEEPSRNFDSSYKYCMLVVDNDNTILNKQVIENGMILERVDDTIITKHNEGNVGQ